MEIEMQNNDDKKQYAEMIIEFGKLELENVQYVILTNTFPEIRVKTPRQNGQLFARFKRNNEASFLAAAQYVGLKKSRLATARKQAVELGVL